MSHEALHWGYNEIEDPNPFWGNWTSTINWCEQDYAVTKYMAEFVNTITNAWVLALIVSLVGIYKYQLPKRYWVIFLGLSCVGLGSWMFHMTLRWEWQVLGDELPMIIVSPEVFNLVTDPLQAASCFLFMVLETTPVKAPPRVQWRNILLCGGLCLGIVLAVSIIYIKTGFAVFHQVSFAIIDFLAAGRVYYLLSKVIKKDDPDPRIKRKRAQIVRVFIMGCFFFSLGFILWNADNLLCQQLMTIKKKIGMPFSFLFELHGWWHLLTGYGTMLMSHAAMLLVLIITEGPQHFELKMWGGWLPIVKRVFVASDVSKGLLEEELTSID